MASPHQQLNIRSMTLPINNIIRKSASLIDTVHLSEWENQFVIGIVEKTSDGSNATSLNDKQVTRLTQIYNTHFSG